MPHRALARHIAEEHPTAIVIFIITLLLLDMFLGAIAIYKVTQQQNEIQDQAARVAVQAKVVAMQQARFQEQARQFAHVQCTTSNDARQSLKDLLEFAKKRVRTTAEATGTDPQEVAKAQDFYNDAIANIHFNKCPAA
jgi:regulatory protein YycI of two-component signal transduction system YycFG